MKSFVFKPRFSVTVAYFPALLFWHRAFLFELRVGQHRLCAGFIDRKFQFYHGRIEPDGRATVTVRP